MKRTKLKDDNPLNTPKCAYASPYICFQDTSEGWALIQACCNHWDCPRCGEIRAREEYGRMVEGAKELAKEKRQLYFWTFTTRGKELNRAEAEEGYPLWTNRLLTNARTRATRKGAYWCYVQVTERQKRGHPHSHMLTTYCPDDVIVYTKGDLLPNLRYARHDLLWSEWYRAASVSAGLGIECDISAVQTPEAVAKYIGKYLFKQTAQDTWPRGWKRVRYSQNWPKLPERVNPTAFPVINRADWFRVASLEVPVRAETVTISVIATHHGAFNVIPPKW